VWRLWLRFAEDGAEGVWRGEFRFVRPLVCQKKIAPGETFELEPGGHSPWAKAEPGHESNLGGTYDGRFPRHVKAAAQL
jgi:hypothetical protein